MNLKEAVDVLNKQVKDPSLGLPDQVFFLISKMTPMVNVDLLIKDEKGRTLLSWRDDQFAGRGWHLPGGIIRFKETLETRVKKVAESEIGTDVSFEPVPIALNQIICDHDVRGHFISILYKCFLPGTFVPDNKGLSKNDRGYLMWHDFCPDNLVKVHEIYRNHI